MRVKEWLTNQVSQNEQRIAKLKRLLADLGSQAGKFEDEAQMLQAEINQHNKDLERLK